MIQVKRVYEPAAESDGTRYLVDRLWPRGVKKESLQLKGWMKDAAPSEGLRRWFNHDAGRWDEFRRRYFVELEEKHEVLWPLLEAARGGTVTLLYGARDPEHNNAEVLRAYLASRL